jgi:hypothetical protein
MMKSIELLPELEKLSGDVASNTFSGFNDLKSVMWTIDARLNGIEVTQALEGVVESLLDWRNVDDSTRTLMEEAYQLAFSRSASSLHMHFSQALEEGPIHTAGFVSSLKGKMAEILNNAKLEELYPDYTFQLGSATQPVWDHLGTAAESPTMMVQSKIGAESYAYDVISRMEASPDTPFMLSSELYEAIASQRPDLIDQIIDSGISNTDFTADTTENVTLLAQNFGLDVPDGLLDVAPYAAEVILAIRLILDCASVESDLANFPRDHKTRIQALRALVLVQKFGVSAVLVSAAGTLGTAAGTAACPGPGSAIGGAVGGIGGAFVAAKVNKCVAPHTLKYALLLTGMSRDDLFYFQNKAVVDAVGASLAATLL